jgi:hypothetical protein
VDRGGGAERDLSEPRMSGTPKRVNVHDESFLAGEGEMPLPYMVRNECRGQRGLGESSVGDVSLQWSVTVDGWTGVEVGGCALPKCPTA